MDNEREIEIYPCAICGDLGQRGDDGLCDECRATLTELSGEQESD